MKPGKLYIKIFLWFLLILCVTEILIFGLFIIAAEKGLGPKLHHFVSGHIQMAKEMVEDKIKSHPDIPLTENGRLEIFISKIGHAYGAKTWLTGTDGKTILKSFKGPIPEQIIESFNRPVRGFENVKVYHGHKRRWGRWEFYAIIPLMLHQGEIGNLHVLFDKKDLGHPWKGFALGLIIIGTVIAIFIIPVTRLITKRVKHLRESAIRISEGDLSHRATVRGKDEIGDLCRSFNRMADKVERMIQGGKELTANVSHELRTPLARIRVSEELLFNKLEEKKLEDWERHLNDIREDIEQMDLLIGRILMLSKLDLHDKPLNRKPFKPASLLEELISRMESTMEHKELRIHSELSKEIFISGDRDALHTAFSNVLNNAVKYTEPKGIIKVNMTAEPSDIMISIINSHSELLQEELKRIFEPFYRTAGNATPGTGLGLALTQKIIEKHGGTITAENVDDGLEIRIRLPIEVK